MVKDAYPLPKISMCLDSLSGVQYFSTFDLQSGYWQICMNEADIPKTAFITKYGLYEYIKMPFGLCSVGSTSQRCMGLVLHGLQWQTLLIYLDDIIVIVIEAQEVQPPAVRSTPSLAILCPSLESNQTPSSLSPSWNGECQQPQGGPAIPGSCELLP